jgi:hypothetical protein
MEGKGILSESTRRTSPDPPADALVGDQLLSALRKAYFRACMDGCRLVGTEYVLEAIVAGPFGPTAASLRHRLRERLSRGDLAGHGADEESVAPSRFAVNASETGVAAEVASSMREAAWEALRRLRPRRSGPEWSDHVSDAVHRALVNARDRSVSYAHEIHLLSAILADPASTASRLLASLGVDPAFLLTRPLPSVSADRCGEPVAIGVRSLLYGGMLDRRATMLQQTGVLIGRTRHAWRQGRLLPRRLPEPVPLGVSLEAVRQAVRLGDQQVGPVHVLIAICAIHRDLHDVNSTFKPRFAEHNRAGRLLKDASLTYPIVAERAAGQSNGTGPVRRLLPGEASPRPPQIGADVITILDAARADASRRRHGYLGLDHVLNALIVEPQWTVRHLLLGWGADPVSLLSELRRHEQSTFDI